MNVTCLTSPLGSLYNLAGPDLIIILVILVLLAAPLAGLVLLFQFLGQRKSAPPQAASSIPPPLPAQLSIAARIRQLDQLKEQNLITQAEYDEQRGKIIRDF
jgi:hypothetical protein